MKIRITTLSGSYIWLCFFLPIIISSSCTQEMLNSKVYEWDILVPEGTRNMQTRKIMKGPTRSLEMFEVNAITLPGGYGNRKYTLKKGTDELIVIKEGMAVISVNEFSERLDEGSVVVASQGDRIEIQNGAKNDLTYYSFRFTPYVTAEETGVAAQIKPFIKDWFDIEFRENANGGRRDIMRQPTSVLRELEMHSSQLKEGLPSHASHVHADEEIILVRFGIVEESINGVPFRCGPGSVIFITGDDDHGIRNAGTIPCEYYAVRWLTYPEEQK